MSEYHSESEAAERLAEQVERPHPRPGRRSRHDDIVGLVLVLVAVSLGVVVLGALAMTAWVSFR